GVADGRRAGQSPAIAAVGMEDAVVEGGDLAARDGRGPARRARGSVVWTPAVEPALSEIVDRGIARKIIPAPGLDDRAVGPGAPDDRAARPQHGDTALLTRHPPA